MYWASAEEIAQSVRYELELNEDGWGKHQAMGVMLHEIAQLKWAEKSGCLEIALQEPATSIDSNWDTLLAVAIKYQLRKDGIQLSSLPAWLHKEPLDVMWWPLAGTPRRATNAFNTTPPELRQVGIFLMRESFK